MLAIDSPALPPTSQRRRRRGRLRNLSAVGIHWSRAGNEDDYTWTARNMKKNEEPAGPRKQRFRVRLFVPDHKR